MTANIPKPRTSFGGYISIIGIVLIISYVVYFIYNLSNEIPSFSSTLFSTAGTYGNLAIGCVPVHAAVQGIGSAASTTAGCSFSCKAPFAADPTCDFCQCTNCSLCKCGPPPNVGDIGSLPYQCDVLILFVILSTI
jgi:hypothetical protein